jgi:autotransporter-associated beta strand protein
MMRTILLAGALLATATSSFAATCTWTGAMDHNWSTPGNWNNCGGAHALPADGDALVFPNGVPRLTNTNDLSKLVASQLTITGGLNVTGNALKLAGGIVAGVFGPEAPPVIGIDISLDTNAQAFSCSGNQPLEITGDVNLSGQSLTIDAGCDVTLGGSLVGSGSLTKNGTGYLRLTATNVYTGPTTINAGFIGASNDHSLGATGTGNETTVNDGATLSLLDGATIGENLFLAGDGVPGPFTVGALAGGNGIVGGDIVLTADTTIDAFFTDSEITLAGDISGAFELTKIGGGMLHWLGVGQPVATLVVDGTLDLRGSATAVTSSAVLAGDGEASGAVTVAQNGFLAPGPVATTMPGTLNAASLTWTAGTHFTWQLGRTSAASDHVAVGGEFARSSTGTFQFQFSDAATPPLAGTTYTLLTFAQSTGFSQGDFSFSYVGTGPGSSMTGIFTLTPGALQFTPSSVVSDLVFRADLDG